MTDKKPLRAGEATPFAAGTSPPPAPPPSLTWVRLHSEASVPFQAYNESAGFDLSACLVADTGRPNKAIVAPNATRLIPTGIALCAPPGHLVLICSRSGLAVRSVFVTNAPGVIDPTYTGEIKILLYNGGHESYYVQHGERIAQALIVPFAAVQLLEGKNALPPTTRGDRGFGSSGQ